MSPDGTRLSAAEGGAELQAPVSVDELAAALAGARGTVRVRGAGSKLAWAPPAEPGLELSTRHLDRVIEHNAGDLTAVLESGVPLAAAQRRFADEGQMLALDPPDAAGATIGGLLASGDSGPLRTRYGAARDLVLGMRVALSDGTVAKSGGKVIKNVAGYDLAKLFTGSFGLLGAILEVAVRLHPLPPTTASAVGRSPDPALVGDAALALSHARLEQLALDVRWEDGAGAVLARFGGSTASAQAVAAERLLDGCGVDTELREDDDELWDAQRDAQRSPGGGLVAKASILQTGLPALIRIASDHGALLVGRAPLGLYWLRLDEGDHAALLRALRERFAVVVLDHPEGFEPGPHEPLDPGARMLAGRVKERFDPDGKLV
jgi:glycolate oxidase FAD binding subunit